MFDFLKPKKHTMRAYLDNAGSAPMSSRALKALTDFALLFGNPSAIHKEGDQASRALQKARNAIATALNAHSYEITFTGTGTESCNMAILGTIYGRQQTGDNRQQKNSEDVTINDQRITSNVLPHIITTTIEHPAVLEPIKKLEREGKVVVSYLPVYENGIIKVKDLREALREETVLVSVMYANNEIGTIQPVKEIGRYLDEWKREKGRTFTSYPYFHTDACQAGNYLNLDVLRLKCHLMTINSSKVYGPKGIAALYKREGIKLDPIIFGGGQERGIRSGTESAMLACSFAEAFTESVEMRDSESERLAALRDYFFSETEKELPGITIYGDRKERLPNNINIRVPGLPSDEMILRLDAKGFAVSHKSACASQESDGSYVVRALGATEEESLENIRITLGRDTSKQDMESLVKVIKEIKEKFAR